MHQYERGGLERCGEIVWPYFKAVSTPTQDKEKAVTIVLSEEMERDIGEWYESHPLLYDKGHRDHPSSIRMTGKLSVDRIAAELAVL